MWQFCVYIIVDNSGISQFNKHSLITFVCQHCTKHSQICAIKVIVVLQPHTDVLMLIVCVCVTQICRYRSKTPPPKRKSRFQSRSHSGSPVPQQVANTEVIPDVVKSCDLSGSETAQKNNAR